MRYLLVVLILLGAQSAYTLANHSAYLAKTCERTIATQEVGTRVTLKVTDAEGATIRNASPVAFGQDDDTVVAFELTDDNTWKASFKPAKGYKVIISVKGYNFVRTRA
jgi:hypothetical protein